MALGPAAATVSDAIAATAVGAVLGPWAGKFVAIAIMISTFSATNSVVLTAPRVFYAMANDNLFFKKLAEVHPRFQTPAAAIVALGVWSAVLTCAGAFAELASGAIFIGWIFYGLGAAAIFPIRRASKGLPIPYRVPGYPWTPLIFVIVAAAIVGNAIFLALTDPQQFRYLAVAIVITLAGASRLLFLAQKTNSRVSSGLHQAQRVHIDEHRGVWNFFGFAIIERTGQKLRKHGALRRFQQKLEAIFFFEARQRRGGGPQNPRPFAVVRQEIFGQLPGPAMAFSRLVSRTITLASEVNGGYAMVLRKFISRSKNAR